MKHLIKFFIKHKYSKSYMVLQFTPCHLTFGGIEWSNQGHWVFIGLCIIDNVLLDSWTVRPRGLLLLPWPTYAKVWVTFVDTRWWIPPCVQRQEKLWHFNKLSCMYYNAHMMYMYTYFVLSSQNWICSCFVHVQQHAPPRIAVAGHPCYDRSLFITNWGTCCGD